MTVVSMSTSFARAMTSKYCVNHTVAICASRFSGPRYNSANESENVRGSRKCCAVPMWLRKRSSSRIDSVSDGREKESSVLGKSGIGESMGFEVWAVETEVLAGDCWPKRDRTWDANAGPEALSVLDTGKRRKKEKFHVPGCNITYMDSDRWIHPVAGDPGHLLVIMVFPLVGSGSRVLSVTN